ncbi:MAG TPA: hypothetical protein VK211_17860 [Kamptonema sp.]|nr:hypothetical protein [Kamptonema sp.]
MVNRTNKSEVSTCGEKVTLIQRYGNAIALWAENRIPSFWDF